jgi:isoquinoline 1-oxidoreductase beta subunit
MSAEVKLSRRTFLQVAGGAGVGLVLSFQLPVARRACAAAGDPVELGAWIRIGTDDLITFQVNESEMGQGVLTSIPMILAEELEADWERVRSVHAETDDERYGVWSTGGSSSVRSAYETLRIAGAAAREMLITAASQVWEVERSACRAERGGVLHVPSGRRLRYGELAARAAKLPAPKQPPLKKSGDFRIIGNPTLRLDSPPKVDGSAVFGTDVRVAGMLFAQVERPPTIGGKLRKFDASAARRLAGIQDVVAIPSGVAVVASGTWAASKGRAALEVSWDPGPHAELSSASIARLSRERVGQGVVARNDGDAEGRMGGVARSVEAAYEFPFLAHATLEPMNCTAHVLDGGCEIWASTQSPSRARDAAARILGLPPEKVTVHTTFLGGGFGRRSATDLVEEAVHVSKAVGAPVQVMCTREDDMRSEHYRPAGYNELIGGLDAEGWPVVWIHRIASQSIIRAKGRELRDGVDRTSVEGARNLPYEIENVRVQWADVELPVMTHWWRSVGSSQNAWVTECFFDELCAAGGKDPVEARLKLLGSHPRHRRALERAVREADRAGPAPEGRARGVAVHECFGSIVAQVAEVSVQPDGTPHVHRVVCAVDCGQVVNPETVRAQMEGGIAFGLTAALFGEVSIEAGRVVPGNFDAYPLLRMGQMPEVETHIIAEGDAMGGIGEPGTPPIAPAVCNALLQLTGKPVRKLPIGRVV